MVQDKAALLPVQYSSDALDRNVNGGAFHVGHGGEHFALAGGFEIAVKGLVDAHAAKLVAAIEMQVERRDVDVECSACACCHGRLPWFVVVVCKYRRGEQCQARYPDERVVFPVHVKDSASHPLRSRW